MVERSDQYDLKKILRGRAQIVFFQIPVSRNKTRFWTPSPEYYSNGIESRPSSNTAQWSNEGNRTLLSQMVPQ